jgi:hypothetical protein
MLKKMNFSEFDINRHKFFGKIDYPKEVYHNTQSITSRSGFLFGIELK